MGDDVMRLVAAALGGGVLAGGGSAMLMRFVLNGLKDDIAGIRSHLQKVDRRLSRIEGRQGSDGQNRREP